MVTIDDDDGENRSSSCSVDRTQCHCGVACRLHQIKRLIATLPGFCHVS